MSLATEIPARDEGMFGDTCDDRTRAWSTEEWLASPYLRRAAARVAHQYGLGPEDLEDFLQELRIALWKNGLATRVSPAWVFRVANHKAVDLLRRRVKTRRRERVFVAMAALPCHDLEIDHLLHAKATSLPSRLRVFYSLHYQQGFSEREIARHLGLCRASVRWLNRCCQRYMTGPGH